MRMQHLPGSKSVNPPRRKLVIWLTGEVEFETSDGCMRRLRAEAF